MAEKCGIYAIWCVASRRFYVGSSKQIYKRWTEHRRTLEIGTSGCTRLMHEWRGHGADSFRFTILEECSVDDLLAREQYYVDTLKPELNTNRDVIRPNPEHVAKLVEANRKRLASITHCPRGHAYDEANTYINKKGKRICRACNALRIAALYAAQSDEEKQKRLSGGNERYYANYAEKRAKQNLYAAEHREQKREYDRLYRMKETTEQKQKRNARAKAAYYANLEYKREMGKKHAAAYRERLKAQEMQV